MKGPDDWRIVPKTEFDFDYINDRINAAPDNSSLRFWRLQRWAHRLEEVEAILWKPSGDIAFFIWEGRETKRLLWGYEYNSWNWRLAE